MKPKNKPDKAPARKPAKRPSHSMADNSLWAVRMLLRHSPAAFWIMLALIPAEIGLQYFGILLPSRVVAEVTQKQTFQHALLATGGIMLALLICDMAKRLLETQKEQKLMLYMQPLSRALNEKSLGMYYQDYERKSVRDMLSQARLTLQRWNGYQPMSDIVQGFFELIRDVLGYALFGTVVSMANPWFLLFVTATPVVNLLSERWFQNWFHSKRKELSDLRQKGDTVLNLPGDFTAAKDIRVYSMGDWLRGLFRELTVKREAFDRQTAWHMSASRIGSVFVWLLRDGGAYALLISMIVRNEITVDQFILYFAAISSMSGWVGGILSSWNKIHGNSLKICDYRDYVDYPDQDGSGEEKADGHLHAAPEIVFDRVSFRYDGAETDALHELSFTLRAGEKLAVVGPNGAGKTTLVKLLCGLYRPTSGEIRINGVPLDKFKRDDYYRLIAPVFQDVRPGFFTLAETVAGTRHEDADLTRAEACLRQAGLGEKLDSLPDGMKTKLDKQINEGGTALSGGELQKLMLARALYKDAPVLVLDEPTAALDPIAESRVYAEYHRMCRNKTAVFISHRLASTAFCDRIFLLEDGRILEEGTHEALVRQNGKYKEMFDIQAVWYRDGAEKGGETA